MLKSEHRNAYQLASHLVTFFSGRVRQPSDFYEIHRLVEKSIRRLVVKWGLKKVVSQEQIQNSILDFVEELTVSPGKSRYCGCLFAEIRLKEKASLRFIHYYTQKRLFTILKANANSLSSEYMRFDAQIKRNLRQLVLANAIFFRRPDRYAARDPEILPDISRFQLEQFVLAQLPLKRIWKNNRIVNRNLRPSLEILLAHPPHDDFRFKKRLISSTLFRLSDELTQRQVNLVAGEGLACHEHSLCSEASEVFSDFLKSLKSSFAGEDFPLNALLLFACLYSDYPGYFSEVDISPDHVESLQAKTGKIDRIFTFTMLVARESSLAKVEFGRTTAFNRLKRLKSLLCSNLHDCSLACRRQVIMKLARFLIRFYEKLRIRNERS